MLLFKWRNHLSNIVVVVLQTWLWISGPLCLYCAERLYRYIRSNKPVTITSVISHPCNVLELRMMKNNFKARPGQVRCLKRIEMTAFNFGVLVVISITECFEHIFFFSITHFSPDDLFQYIILHCPRVSALESHPFTLTMVRHHFYFDLLLFHSFPLYLFLVSACSLFFTEKIL